MIDQIDIHKNNLLDSWYEKVAYVPQSIYLLNESIKKNILLGIEESEEIEENYNDAINISLCIEFIEKMRDYDQTIVGENGLKLSGGQIQRLGIARAIYQQKEVLVLDEATNSLDENTEKDILKNILKIKNKPTIIFVSHKSSNFDICNKIIDLKNINS
jgi:ATP-binding cassette subfamily C protein